MKNHTNVEPETRAQAIDPVCGMRVSKDSQHRHAHEGKQYLFCSGSCHDKFVSTPDKYLKPEENTTEEESAASLYTCPMHPEIQQTGPGACPKCGMALEPAGIPVAASKTEYTCPMHPEIVRDHPGSCPKCGINSSTVISSILGRNTSFSAPVSSFNESNEFHDSMNSE